MASIRQKTYPDLLPDFRNLGVIARLLLAVNAAALAMAMAASSGFAQAVERFMNTAVVVEPLLLAIVFILFAATRLLARLPYWAGCIAVLFVVLVLALGQQAAMRDVTQEPTAGFPQVAILCTLAVASLLAYFRLHTKAYSPALAEARLQALQARIRPHFLFNSLNAVLSLIRREPKRAERALEDLSDLFRILMSDARQFVRLADDIALLERYAALEELRLGERLRVIWEIDSAPMDALLPPLVLQPLLENAVYHGVEPGAGTGEVLVRIEQRGARVHARIENPYVEVEQLRAGNRMALENIQERLTLFFDAEAHIQTGVSAGRFRVDLEMPYRTA